MRVAVTGANGFVGRSVVAAIGAKGWHPVGVGRRRDGWQSDSSEWRTVRDPWSPVDWQVNLRDVDAVVHLIGLTHHTRSGGDDLDAYLRVNVDITSALISAAETTNLRALVYMSSVKAVAETTENEPIEASTPASPKTPYGITKLRAEDLLEAQKNAIQVVILRPPMVYGARVKGNMLRLMQLADSPLPLPFGRIQNARSLISLDNLTDAVISALEVETIGVPRLPLADPYPITTTELVRHLREFLNRPSRLIPVPARWLDAVARILGVSERISKLTEDLVISNADAEVALGWVPRQSTAEGLAVMVDSYLATDGWTRPPQ